MKKKIAIYNGQLYMGGIERVLINYLEKLSKEPELDITLIIKQNIPEDNVFLPEVPKNIKIVYVKSEEMCRRTDRLRKDKKNIVSRLQYQWALFYERIIMKQWVKSFFEENNFDVVIDFDMSLMKYLECIKTSVVGWLHYTLKGKKAKRIKLYRKTFKNYRNIVVICDDMKKELEEIYPEYVEKTVRIYNPMDFDIIKAKAEDRSEITLEDEKLLKNDFFIAVSRLVEVKNRVGLVEIFAELKKKGIKEKLYILGEGEDRPNIERKIKELNLEEDVLLLGQKKNPFPYMKAAKMFLHTSRGEGLPTVFIESMLCDTIVVAYDCPTGPREILEDGKAGGLVPLGDQKTFEKVVLNILSDKELEKSIKSEMYKKMDEFNYGYIRKDLFKLF
ncbi:glycosyltransferase [Cetobacterium sp.]|uniref:glycosyltransferase n=1 Tax=Cetobacterium sp. TaxID=2071632 RepID=UPI003F3446EB